MEEAKHILLVEDEAAHMELIRRAFECSSSPYRLWAVESLGEAEKYLEGNTPHLIITDWKLPDGNGLKLVGRKRDGSEVPVVIMTSHENERVVVAALQAGALDYVVKSVETMSDMPHTAERALREWDHRAEQTRMQNALRESEKKYRFLAENVADVIWTADTNLRVTYISPSVEKPQGWTVHEWLELRPQDYISSRSLQRIFHAPIYLRYC